jgi:hypothetical protein
MYSRSTGGDVQRNRFLAAAAIGIIVASFGAAIVLGFSGYGADPDIYRLIAVWQHIVLTGEYLPSRTPGHVFPELFIGITSSLLPMPAVNLLVTAICGATAWLYLRFLRSYHGREVSLLALAILVSNPYFILAASSSNDCGFGISFFIFGGYALWRWRPALAAALFALATSARSEIGPLCFVLLSLHGPLVARERLATTTVTAGLFVLLVFLLWLPVLISQHMTLVFLEPMTKIGGSLSERFVRWTYKVVMFFGIPAAIAIGGGALWALRRKSSKSGERRPQRGVLLGTLASLAYFLVLFWWQPIVNTPLLPILYLLPLLLLIIGVPRIALLAIAAAQVLTWFVSPDILEITYRSRGVGQKTVPIEAKLRPHLASGVLLDEARKRVVYDRFYLETILPAPPRNIYTNVPASPPPAGTVRGKLKHIGNRYDFFPNDQSEQPEECERARHGPDAEPGSRVPGAGSHTRWP